MRKGTVNRTGTHGLLCAKGESVRGHNCVRDELHTMSKAVDPNSETEPEGLIPSRPLLRPADVLTGAFHGGRLAAVDVGIICPSACGAGLDCVATMHDRKAQRMNQFAEELEAGAVEYAPFAISCWGRLHDNSKQMLRNLAKQIARRQGRSNEQPIYRRLLARINAVVWRRAARMVNACLPKEAWEEDEEEDVDDDTPDAAGALRAGSPDTSELPAYL